jgi:hypothetical protein
MSGRIVLGVVLAAAIPAPSYAQTPPSQPPAPAAGKATFGVSGGLAIGKTRYFARGQRVRVNGRVTPFVAGQQVTLYVLRSRGRISSQHRVAVGRGGRFGASFVPRRRGTLRLVVRHDATAEQQAFRARSRRIRVVVWRAGAGSRGTKVLLMQRALRMLGFATPVTGSYGAGTSRAVLAFRKTNHMGRSGYASPAVFGKLLRRRGAFRLRYPRAGRHVEFDWSRQVLVLAGRGRAWRVYHASSGKPSTPTVFGTFRFYRKQPGTNSHGMVHSSYFIGGYAIHGYASVPNYPASHGCIRIPIPNARDVFNRISLGERVFVYR